MYGALSSARDLVSNEKVAIKKISSALEDLTESVRTLREIKLLRHLQHDNIVQIKDIIPPKPGANFRDVYVVYELMDTDLHQVIRSPQSLSDEHCQFFIYQILRGLKYVHSAGVLHRDIKPSNLLVNANCDLKICDFGLARTSQEKEFMTEYVVTRWYRAPELLLSCLDYTEAIDVWSVGCIIAELLGRKPLFPGRDYVHQLTLIVEVLGNPSEEEMKFVSSDKAKRYLRSMARCPSKDLAAMWPHANKKAIDLIQRMLQFNPAHRITIEEALAHPYLADLHDETDEPRCEIQFQFDDGNLQPNDVREMLYQEMLYFHPEPH